MRLSILIPAYNAEKYITRCLQSVLDQPKLFNIEIIVINDGSTDATEKIVRQLMLKHPVIQLFNISNQGVYKARNYGLEKVTGDFIWMLDADDYIAEEAFIVLKNAVASEEKIDVYHLGYRQEIKTKIFETRLPPGENKEILNGIEFLNRNDGRLFLWNNIYRTAFLKENEFKFLAKSVSLEDSLFNLNVFSKAKRVSFISNCMYSYLLNPSSISRTKQKQHLLNQGESSINVHLKTKKLKESYSASSDAYQVLQKRLDHSVLGFFYSMYIEKYPLTYIKQIFRIYNKEGLLPVKKSKKNFKLLIFQKMINLKWPFILLCKFNK